MDERRERREELARQHRAALERRGRAPLGSEEYREAAHEVGRIEVEIAAVVEPSIEEQLGSQSAKG